MPGSRTHNALKNSIFTLICQIVGLVVGFIGRTVLTNILGAEYLGINGLFANVLSILSFAELGIGSTLVYRLYKPVANEDRARIAALIKLYKRIYEVIIVLIIFLGIVIIPFLKYIVDAPDVKENLILLYLLYLADTIITYAFVYKKAILTADQKQYIISLFNQLFNIAANVIQCIALALTHDFILYLLIKIICNLLNNITCSLYAQKKYLYISPKETGAIDKAEIDGLKKDAKGLFLTKIASTAFGSTDNIFISAFMGIGYVGILSNYTMIISIINSIINSIFESITASIGNLNVTGDFEKTEQVLHRLYFINASFYSYVCIGMTLLIQDFVMHIWLSEEYYLSMFIVITAFVELFFRSLHFPIYTTRNSLGLFSQYKVLFAVSALLNLALDAVLIVPLGIAGLFIATIICRGITYIADITAVYKYGFKKKPTQYYKNAAIWTAFTVVLGTVLYFIVGLITVTGIAGFIMKFILITAAYFLVYFLAFRKNKCFRFFIDLSRTMMNRRKKV